MLPIPNISATRLILPTIMIAAAFPATASAQGVPGGKSAGAYHSEAIAHRARVQNQVANLLAELGDTWDRNKPAEVARFYAPHGTIVLGPLKSIQGRDEIRKALAGPLGQMRSAMFTIEEYDLSGELAYVRGTMRYEIVHGGDRLPSMEVATFTMSLRQRYDDWLIVSHTIGLAPALPPASVAGTEGKEASF
jgi:ketosteroid isomerase-like protein